MLKSGTLTPFNETFPYQPDLQTIMNSVITYVYLKGEDS